MKKVHDKVKKYLQARNWDHNEPVDISKSIVIESAELLELFQWNNKKRADVLKDKKILEELKGELADVFIYSLGMAISLGINPETVILDKLKKVEKKYPVKKIKSDKRNYLKIKNEYRRNKK